MLKTAIAAAALIAASYVAGTSPAAAQFNAEWCTEGHTTDCAYHTLAQCRAAASGNGWDCVRNPALPRKERHRR